MVNCSSWGTCKENAKLHFVLVMIQVAFSTVNVFGTKGVAGISPIAFVCVRYFATALVGLVLCLIFEADSYMESIRDWRTNLKYLWLGIGLPQVCSSVTYLYGLEYSNPVNCGILYLLSVPTTAIFGMLLKLEQRSYVKLCGVLFAFGGALVMLELDKFSMSNDTIIGDLIVLGMVLFHATYLLITKRLSSGFKAFTVTFWSFFSGACFTFIPLPIMMLTSTPITYSAFTPDIWISIAIVCIIGTAIPGLSVIWALQNSSSLVVAVYSPLELVATVLLGLIFLNLELKWVHGVGAVLIVSGLFIVLYAKHKEQMEEQKKDPPGGNPVTEHQETNEDPTESERLSLVSLDK